MKICFFDMEGTLLEKNLSLDNGKVAPSAWTVLAKEISEACYIEEEKQKIYGSQINTSVIRNG
jgi:hypothetical protein